MGVCCYLQTCNSIVNNVSDGVSIWAKFNGHITKYGSTLYIGMDKVFQHHAHTFEKSNLNFHFQCEFSSVVAER